MDPIQTVSFLDIPAGVRCRIYEYAFRCRSAVVATSLLNRHDLALRNGVGHTYQERLSSQMLRTCKTIANEGKVHLYDHNTFKVSEPNEMRQLSNMASTSKSRSFIRSIKVKEHVLCEARIPEFRPFRSLRRMTLVYDLMAVKCGASGNTKDAFEADFTKFANAWNRGDDWVVVMDAFPSVAYNIMCSVELEYEVGRLFMADLSLYRVPAPAPGVPRIRIRASLDHGGLYDSISKLPYQWEEEAEEEDEGLADINTV